MIVPGIGVTEPSATNTPLVALRLSVSVVVSVTMTSSTGWMLSAKRRWLPKPITDEEALDGFKLLSRTEGIIPALESSHAIAQVAKMAPGMDKNEVIVVCLSGRGDKDVNQIAERMGDTL